MSKTSGVARTYSPQEISFHKELADVYFSKKPPTSKKTKRNRSAARKAAFPFPLIAALSILLAIIVISAAVFLVAAVFRQGTARFCAQLKSAPLVMLLGEGRANGLIVKREDLAAAYRAQKQGRNAFVTLTLASPGQQSLGMNFKVPIDISDRDLSLYLKGRRGGEALMLSLRDSARRSYRFDALYLESQWSKRTLPLQRIRGTIDLTKIEQLTAEYESDATSRDQQEVYIRDIVLVKDEG